MDLGVAEVKPGLVERMSSLLQPGLCKLDRRRLIS